MNEKSSILGVIGASNDKSKTLINRLGEGSDLPFASSILKGKGEQEQIYFPLLLRYCWRFVGHTPHFNEKSTISDTSGASNGGSKTLLIRSGEGSDLPFASSILERVGGEVLNKHEKSS
ncbi:hypothetical protein NIES2101_26400 [Calothrix sp. HK-06]|nr:hypothetical protein NIES2101_26400 [Calothrix sp. HK-06]